MRTYTFAPGAIGVALSMFPVSCATTKPPDDPTQRAAMLDQLRAGTANLDCSSIACSGAWGTIRRATGMADVSCIVTVVGTTRDCALVALAGTRDFGSAVLAYARALSYVPARRGGVTVEQVRHYRLVLTD